MSQEPYASAKRVFWIVDTGSSHRGDAAAQRLTEAFPTTVMVHTPIHASWLNQVEIYYSIVQRKGLSPNDFTDLTEVETRLASFEQRFNATAAPFNWKFAADDLDDLLTRIDRHERAHQPTPRRSSTPHDYRRTSGRDRPRTAVRPTPQVSSAPRPPPPARPARRTRRPNRGDQVRLGSTEPTRPRQSEDLWVLPAGEATPSCPCPCRREGRVSGLASPPVGRQSAWARFCGS